MSQICKKSQLNLNSSQVRFEKTKFTVTSISPDVQEVIRIALFSGPKDHVLVEGFGLRLKREDMLTLSGLKWLNDEVINFYMNLLIQRSKSDNLPNVYAMNTFFYPKILSGGQVSVQSWTKNVDIFSKDLLLIPIHLGLHWCIAIIDFRKKKFVTMIAWGQLTISV